MSHKEQGPEMMPAALENPPVADFDKLSTKELEQIAREGKKAMGVVSEGRETVSTEDLESGVDRAQLGSASLEVPVAEQEALQEKQKGIWESVKGAAQKTFDYLVVEPGTWLWEKVKEHPYRTAAIVMAAVLMCLLMAPVPPSLDVLAQGASQILSQGVEQAIPYSSSIFKTLEGLIASRMA